MDLSGNVSTWSFVYFYKYLQQYNSLLIFVVFINDVIHLKLYQYVTLSSVFTVN